MQLEKECWRRSGTEVQLVKKKQVAAAKENRGAAGKKKKVVGGQLDGGRWKEVVDEG